MRVRHSVRGLDDAGKHRDVALNGQVLPLDALELILALTERLEQRVDDIEARTPHRPH